MQCSAAKHGISIPSNVSGAFTGKQLCMTAVVSQTLGTKLMFAGSNLYVSGKIASNKQS